MSYYLENVSSCTSLNTWMGNICRKRIEICNEIDRWFTANHRVVTSLCLISTSGDVQRLCTSAEIIIRALILFIQTLALYKSFTYLLTYLLWSTLAGVCTVLSVSCLLNCRSLNELWSVFYGVHVNRSEGDQVTWLPAATVLNPSTGVFADVSASWKTIPTISLRTMSRVSWTVAIV